MIALLSHDKWVLLNVGSTYHSVDEQQLGLLRAAYFILDLSDPTDSLEDKLNWDIFWPNTPSSFSGQILSDGYVKFRTHVWNDLIQLKTEGVLACLPLKRLPINDSIPSGQTNLLSRDGHYAQILFAGRNPINRTYVQNWSLWSKRPYKQYYFNAYWTRGLMRVVALNVQPPKLFTDGFIVGSEWTTYPTFVEFKSFSFRVTAYLYRGSGRWSRQSFSVDTILTKSMTSTTLFNAFIKACQIHVGEWHRVLLNTVSRDPSYWDNGLNHCYKYNGTTLSLPQSPSYDKLCEFYFPDSPTINWHQLAAEAYQDLGMADINGVANIKELLEMGSAVTSFTRTLKSLPSKRVKAAAQAWLAVHYGFKLTVLDAQELYHTLNDWTYRRSSISKCQSSGQQFVRTSSYEYRYQVFFDSFAQLRSTLLQCIAISDAFLTLENGWDMVPWSFVIDWFVDLGSVLQSLDNWFNLRQRHEVVAVGRSIKAQRSVESSSLFTYGVGNFDVTWYRREYNKELISPSIIPSVTINPFNHLVEAAALVISLK